jgi:hypothetical protein
MANLKLNLNIDIKSLQSRFVKNLSWLFFAGFLVLLIMECFEINQSVQIILNSNQQPAPASQEQGVRINFDAYNKAVSKIQAGQNFVPSGGVASSPFGTGQ